MIDGFSDRWQSEKEYGIMHSQLECNSDVIFFFLKIERINLNLSFFFYFKIHLLKFLEKCIRNYLLRKIFKSLLKVYEEAYLKEPLIEFSNSEC